MSRRELLAMPALAALEPQLHDFDPAVVGWFWYGVIVWLCQCRVGRVEPSTPPELSIAAILIGAELRPTPKECRR